MTEILIQELDKLVGNKTLKVTAGSGGGSIITIEFGDQLNLSPKSFGKYNIYEGDFSMMIYCSWRLESKDTVLTSWNEDNYDDGPMVMNLKKLLNVKIKSYDLYSFFDLKIHFENEYVLSVFCDLSLRQEFDCNWFLRNKKVIYSISNKYQCTEEFIK